MRTYLLLLGLIACNKPSPSAQDDTGPAGVVDDTGEATLRCDGLPGRFREQELAVDGTLRHYFLYVPSSYTCDVPMPVLLDFHGTGGGTSADDPVEEYYTLEPLVDLAEAEGFIVLRPRSMSQLSGGTYIYQWDAGPGHLADNLRFSEVLLEELGRHYRLGPLLAFGFSNGTNMATQLLGEGGPDVMALGAVGGGYWDDPGFRSLDGLRVWSLTGYRDYMLTWRRRLDDALPTHGVAPEDIQIPEVDTGHDLYGWHYRAFWDWA